jgi:hypothetical protein
MAAGSDRLQEVPGMACWYWLAGGLAVCGLAAALYGLDRLGLWLEDRGWLYYRRKQPSSSPLSALVALHRFIEPGLRHVVATERGGGQQDREAAKERLLARLLACLAGLPVNHEEVRLCLAAARAAGLDWERLYDEAVQVQRSARPDRAHAIPAAEDVAPPG